MAFFIFAFFLVNKIYSNEVILSIRSFGHLNNSNFIVPAIDEENNLYIITGECNNGTSTYSYYRNLLKFNSSGILIENKNFSFDQEFKNPEIDYFENEYGQFLLISTSLSIELYNISNNLIIKSIHQNSYGYKFSLKKLFNNNYFYSYIEINNNNNYYLGFINISLNLESKEFFSLSHHQRNQINSNSSIISCDTTYDEYKNIICVYINYNNSLVISSYNSNNFKSNINKALENNDKYNYFYKVIYFKDSTKFIVMNSFDENNSRLRYYKYKNNIFLNQLSFISDDENDYIQFGETQISPNYEYNDIIAINSTKILKISVLLNNIIISIFNFLNSDTTLQINSFKFINNGNYNSFKNPRLSIFNNIIVVCLSTLNINKIETGFFFIGYPKQNKTSISDNNDIKIKDLMFIENNLFDFEPKIRIIEIPEDFILYNSSNITLKKGTYLSMDDSIVFIEYKKSYLANLKYEIISIGNFNKNNKSIQTFPSYTSNKNENLNSEIEINGYTAILDINISKCDNGFALIEEKNICTKIHPEGYYFNISKNEYIKCFENCKTCSGGFVDEYHMNCEKCIDGYNITEDTKSCYNNLPLHYFLDNGIFRRCSENCTKCFNSTNDTCLECIKDFTFFLSKNSCIFNNDIEEMTLEHTHSRFRLVFVIIFFMAIIFGLIIVFRPIKRVESEASRYTFVGIKNEKAEDKRTSSYFREMGILNW